MADQLGSDFRWPWHLPAALCTAGFAEVKPTTIPFVTSVTGAVNDFWRINLTELGPAMVESGYVERDTLAEALATLDDPDHVDLVMAFVCVSCRRRTAKERTCSVLHPETEGVGDGRPDQDHSH